MTYILAYLLNLFDLYMTLYWVHRYGLEAEGNPVGGVGVQTTAVCGLAMTYLGHRRWPVPSIKNILRSERYGDQDISKGQ